ncbi:MAG: hypothetical protein U0L67_00160 [Paludibacteraceae bacterium]|nr:hypothetical protein [Paludibacteraceae bacterium]
MRKLVFILFILCVHFSALAQEPNLLGVYVNEIAIKYVDSLSYYTKVFDCTKLQEVILYQDMDFDEGHSWKESLYTNDDMSILFYSPLTVPGGDSEDKGKTFPLNFTFNSPKYRVSINGKQVSVGMSQEKLFELFPELYSYYEEYNKDHISPFRVDYFVKSCLLAKCYFGDPYCPIYFTLNEGIVESISIETRTIEELLGWVEFDCCVKKIK